MGFIVSSDWLGGLLNAAVTPHAAALSHPSLMLLDASPAYLILPLPLASLLDTYKERIRESENRHEIDREVLSSFDLIIITSMMRVCVCVCKQSIPRSCTRHLVITPLSTERHA